MIKRSNNREKNDKYDNFKMHQQIISNLQKGDNVELYINGVLEFSCQVVHGVNSHVNVSLQDKGNKLQPLTPDQLSQAITEYRINHPTP